MNPSTIFQIRQTAAELLAVAVLDLCPDAFIIEGRATSAGFAYDFYFPSPFSKDMLPYLEERIQQLIQEDLPIERREMMPDNASELFRSYPFYYPAIFARQHIGPLVDVFHMKGFCDLCPGPYVQSTREIGIVKLIALTKRPPIRYRGVNKPVTRITGIVCQDKQKLKEFLKNRKQFFEAEHRNYGVKNDYFLIRVHRNKSLHEVHHCFWLRKGNKVKELLYDYWREAHEKIGYNVIQTQGNNLLKNHEEFFGFSGKRSEKSVKKIAEYSRVVSEEGIDRWDGLFGSKDYYFDRAHVFCVKEDLHPELISSLQFVERTFKIFGFNAQIVLLTPKKDKELYQYLSRACEAVSLKVQEEQGKVARAFWRVIDRYEVMHDSSFVELKRNQKGFVIAHSIFNRLEQFIALMMDIKGPSFEERVKHIAKKTKFE